MPGRSCCPAPAGEWTNKPSGMSSGFATAAKGAGFGYNDTMRSTGRSIHPAVAGALLALLLSIHPRTPLLSPAPLSRAQVVLALERCAPEGYCVGGRSSGIERPAREPHPVFALGGACAAIFPPAPERADVECKETGVSSAPREGIVLGRAPPAGGSSSCCPRQSRA